MAHRENPKPFSQLQKTGRILDFDLQSGTSKTSPVMSVSENGESVSASMNGSIIDYLPTQRSSGFGGTLDTIPGTMSGLESLQYDASMSQGAPVYIDERNDIPSEDSTPVNNLSNKLLVSQMDELELRQAQEQSRLLQKFKELRQWQSQQQDLLMLQQQQQLEVLRSEQMKFQAAMTKQRNNQWGATVNGAGSTSPSRTPRKNRPGGGVAQALANSVLAKSEMTKTLLPQQIAALIENSAYYAEQHQGNQFAAMDEDKDSDFGCETDSNFESAMEFDGEIQKLPDVAPVYKNETKQGRLESGEIMTRAKLAPSLLNRIHSANKVNTDVEIDEGIGTQSLGSYAPVPDTMDLTEKLNIKNLQKTSQEYVEQESELPDEGDDDEYVEEKDNVHTEHVRHDDIPINTGLAGKKTFEQLLEEKLRAEEEKLQALNNESPTVEKKTFLKKGEGITARFFSKPKHSSSKKKSKTAASTSSPQHGTRPSQSSRSSKMEDKTKPVSRSPKQSRHIVPSKSKSPPSKDAPSMKSSKVPNKTTKNLSKVPPTVPSSSKTEPAKRAEAVKTEKSTAASSVKTNTKLTDKLKMIKELKISDSESLPDDASFIQNLKDREEKAEEEIEELEQFELLEELADNISLCSTNSVVRRVLNKEKITSDMLQKCQPFVNRNNQLLCVGSVMNRQQQISQVQSQQQQKKETHHQNQQQQSNVTSMPSVTSSTATSTAGKSDWSSIKIGTSYSDSDSWEDADSDDSEGSIKNNAKTKRTIIQESQTRSSSSAVSSDNTALNTDTDSYFGITKTSKQSPRKENELNTFKEFISSCGDGGNSLVTDVQTVPKSPSKILTRKVVVCDSRLNDRALPNSQGDAQYIPPPSNPAILSSLDTMTSISDPHHKQKYFVKHKGSENLEMIDVSDSSDSDDVIHIDKQMTRPSDKETVDNSSSDSDKFDDEDEWDSEIVMKKFTTKSKEGELDDTLTPKSEHGSSSRTRHVHQVNEENHDSTPPTSRLMTQLFPKLKQQPSKAAQQEIHAKETLQTVTQQSTIDGIQSKVLRTKLNELEKEIERFRDENSSLEKMRKEREEGLAKLKKEITNFEKEKENELKRLQEFKAEEMKKLKHERKMFEKYQKTIRSMPDKKDREEIEMLKDQLTELQEEMKRKEARWSSSTSRLKDRLEHLELENQELREEIKVMEKKRLEWLQKEQNAKKSNVTKLTPRSNSPTNQDVLTQSLPANFSSKNKPPEQFGTHQIQQPIAADGHFEDGHKKKTVNKPRTSSGNLKTTEKKKFNQRQSTDKVKPSVNSLQKSSQPPVNGKPADVAVKNHAQPLRTSLAEDIPRKSLANEVLPQDVSMYSEPDVDDPTNRSQQIPRKFASKFNVDRSMIDKDAEYEENRHSDGKVERIYRTGAREILFANGTRKEISSDGQSIVVSFFNGDIKQIMADQRVIYYYAETQTTHSTYQDGLEILQFANNQTEKHYPDGTKEITFPDQTIKYLFPNGSEESIFPDGTVIRINQKGEKTMEFPNGQREIHTDQFKKREYPDGTVKTVYPDGRQETTYSNGRIRIKDKDGNVIVDRTR